MFTGIIEETGVLRNKVVTGNKTEIVIACKKVTKELKCGDSIACNGICLTVTSFTKESITVELMAETLNKTTAGKWKPGEIINLERALSLNGRLDGHLVQGHIDTVTDFISREIVGNTQYLWFRLPAANRNLVVAQGSIAVNGISLTIARLEKERFAVALISHTLAETNLSEPGKKVNLEFDIIGKYVERKLETSGKTGITMEWLNENNF